MACPPVLTWKEAGWTPENVWIDVEKENPVAPVENGTLIPHPLLLQSSFS
jgi:hypothetical protein